MSRAKQTEIEEMAKAVCHLDRTCDECMTSFECKAMMYAKRFYNAGYRKSTDFAKEIFAEIESCIWSETHYGDSKLCFEINSAKYAELKKKYIGEDTNVTTKESEKDNG